MKYQKLPTSIIKRKLLLIPRHLINSSKLIYKQKHIFNIIRLIIIKETLKFHVNRTLKN